MKGVKHIKVSNRFVQFEFNLYRNITIVRGNSGTGKTTLYSLVAEYMLAGVNSGVNIASPCPLKALTDYDWLGQLNTIHSSVVFIDEGASCLTFAESKKFKEAVRNSDNYYVMFTREDFHDLPYSVDEIYEIKSSGKKFHSFSRVYAPQLKTRCFPSAKKTTGFKILLTEDSKAGFRFFEAVFRPQGIQCEAAGANSSIFGWLKENPDKKVFIIADGAAFGSEINRVSQAMEENKNAVLFLPESFEWLILKSGLVDGVSEILENPAEFIESADWLSWERFFTDLLIHRTEGTYLAYKKSSLNPAYLQAKESKAILLLIPVIEKRNL